MGFVVTPSPCQTVNLTGDYFVTKLAFDPQCLREMALDFVTKHCPIIGHMKRLFPRGLPRALLDQSAEAAVPDIGDELRGFLDSVTYRTFNVLFCGGQENEHVNTALALRPQQQIVGDLVLEPEIFFKSCLQFAESFPKPFLHFSL